jgi:phosphoglucomutase/phosphomannomutase
MSTQFEELASNFLNLKFESNSIQKAINHIKLWLLHPEFEIYKDQIEYLIKNEQFTELFDSFYQIIPFGTAGRRGKVGIGYNRINQWTIAASAQGHSQYLLKKFGDEARERGIVIAYDVRQYTNQKVYSNYINNPIWGISSKEFAEIAASVYSKNSIKVHIFHDVRSTPQLSFTIRELKAISGMNVTASHNPPEYNGIKIYEELGGQIIPPHDQELIDEINNNVNIYDVQWGDYNKEKEKGLIKVISEAKEAKYINAVRKISLSRNREACIIYSPLHGTGKTSVYKVMKSMDFDIHIEPQGSVPSGEFESVPNHVPDPANLNVYWNGMNYADEMNADLIITTDPDADRVGIMVKNRKGKWVLLDGNEMCTLLTYYVIEKNKKLGKLPENGIIFSTIPVTKLLARIAKKNKLKIVDDLYPGFKYIAHEMNKLVEKNKISDFLAGMEDTHGHVVGNYVRDKDACASAILLSEFAGELKNKNLTLIEALEAIHKQYGFHKCLTCQIKFEYSYEKGKLEKAFKLLRKEQGNVFDKYKVTKFIDHLEREKIKSATDANSRDVLEIHFEDIEDFEFFRICVRPSGTEPIAKIYIELGTSLNLNELDSLEKKAYKELQVLSEYFIKSIQKLMD